MNAKDLLRESKRKQFYNDYKKLDNYFRKGEKLNINGIDYGIESMNAYFDESVLELRLIHIGNPLQYIHKKEFKAGDKVKLNQPMNPSMEKQVPYRKYYDVVVTDSMDCGGDKLQILGIDGVKGMVSSEYFDLYMEYDNTEKIEDEFNVGDFVILKENDNKPSELEFNNIYKVESVKQTGFKFIKIEGKKYYWRTYLFNKVNLDNIKFEK